MNETFNLTLCNAAKSVGGDKYSYTGQQNKVSFIYVPQNYSRPVKVASLTLNLIISTQSGNIAFNLIKQGKTGDDRYTPEDESLWKGDVYVDHKFRNAQNKIYLSVN